MKTTSITSLLLVLVLLLTLTCCKKADTNTSSSEVSSQATSTVSIPITLNDEISSQEAQNSNSSSNESTNTNSDSNNNTNNTSSTNTTNTQTTDSLKDDEIEYIKKLLVCIPDANFSSKFTLDDQIVLGFAENIINYQESTGDNFCLSYNKENNKAVFTKEMAVNFATNIFTFDLQHTSDYLLGEKYYFNINSSKSYPSIQIEDDIKNLGVIFQITYYINSVKHIATVYRNTDSSYPFRIHSITINS